MATTKKEGAQVKERTSRPSLGATTTHSPHARPTKSSSPAGSSSEKETSPRKRTPNYLKPTFSSSADATATRQVKAASTARAPQKNPPIKSVTADAKAQPQRSSSFTTPRAARAPALSSRSSFSSRTSREKAEEIHSALKPAGKLGNGAVPKGRTSAASSAATSAATSAANSTATSPKATEETLSNEDREAALDILNLDVEETGLLDIPPVEDKALTDEPVHVEEEAEETTGFVEHEHVVNSAEEGDHEQHHDDSDRGEEVKEGDAMEEEGEKAHEEAPSVEAAEKEYTEKPEEEKVMVEVSASDGDGSAAVVEANEEGVDGGGERVKLRVSGAEEEAKEKGKEAAAAQQQQHGKKEAALAYNDVIEETARKLAEKRKSKVLALAGAFETVISLDSGGPGQ